VSEIILQRLIDVQLWRYASLSPVALAGASTAPATTDADAELLGLYERIMFDLYEKAHEHDDEMIRLQEIWHDELRRLRLLRLTGKSSRSEAEDWKLVADMPESHEHTRLVKLTGPFHEMEVLIERMMVIPAQTSAGRAAKVDVLLSCLMGDDWVAPNDEAEYDIRTARNLIFEFVGGEPAEELRQQFATPIAD
jgi:hypothetical protein